MKNTQQQSNKLLNNKFLIIGLVAILIAGIVGAGILSLSTSAATDDSVWVATENNGDSSLPGGDTYVGGSGDEITIERWKYTIRDDDTCDSSVFADGGDTSNLIDIVYNSNSYTPSGEKEIDLYNDKYICFAALDDGSRWHHVNRQLSWIYPVNTSTADCEDDEILTPGGACVELADCEEDEILTPGGTCIEYEEPEDPCSSEEDTSPECLASDTSTQSSNDCVDDGEFENSDGECYDPNCPGDGLTNADGECIEYEEPTEGTDLDLTLSERAAERFDDVSLSDNYAEAVGFLLEHEVTTGCDEDSFCPEEQLTRAQFVTFLYRLLNPAKYPQTGSEIFEDVEAGSFADNAIGWAAYTRITTGCQTEEDDGLFFCPERTLSRAHIATFLHRLTAETDFADLDFEDVDETAYYANAADWAVTNGIMYSCGDLFFCPGGSVTRGEAATIIYYFAITPESWGSANLTIGIK